MRGRIYSVVLDPRHQWFYTGVNLGETFTTAITPGIDEVDTTHA